MKYYILAQGNSYLMTLKKYFLNCLLKTIDSGVKDFK